MIEEIRGYINVAFPGCDANLYFFGRSKPWKIEIEFANGSICIEVPVDASGFRGKPTWRSQLKSTSIEESTLTDHLMDLLVSRLQWYADGHNKSRMRDLMERVMDSDPSRFVGGCTCRIGTVEDGGRILVAGESDCPVHGFGKE